MRVVLDKVQIFLLNTQMFSSIHHLVSVFLLFVMMSFFCYTSRFPEAALLVLSTTCVLAGLVLVLGFCF